MQLFGAMPSGRAYKSLTNGRSTVDKPGIDYSVEYYLHYPAILRTDVLLGESRMAAADFWSSNEVERRNLSDFAKKYYLQIPDSMKSVCGDFKKDCKSAGLTKTSDIILEAKSYITKDTTYSLSPGKTPSGKESIEYFLKENKKDIVPIMRRQPLSLLRSYGNPGTLRRGYVCQ